MKIRVLNALQIVIRVGIGQVRSDLDRLEPGRIFFLSNLTLAYHKPFFLA